MQPFKDRSVQRSIISTLTYLVRHLKVLLVELLLLLQHRNKLEWTSLGTAMFFLWVARRFKKSSTRNSIYIIALRIVIPLIKRERLNQRQIAIRFVMRLFTIFFYIIRNWVMYKLECFYWKIWGKNLFMWGFVGNPPTSSEDEDVLYILELFTVSFNSKILSLYECNCINILLRADQLCNCV